MQHHSPTTTHTLVRRVQFSLVAVLLAAVACFGLLGATTSGADAGWGTECRSSTTGFPGGSVTVTECRRVCDMVGSITPSCGTGPNGEVLTSYTGPWRVTDFEVNYE